jgi:hypothetical protein
MRPQSSIYSAEQQAIITAMENTTPTHKPTIIVTDSFSSLLPASENRWTWNPNTKNIRRLIDEPRNHIKLIWVPSHVGIVENEAADQAVKGALKEEIDNQEPFSPKDLMKWINKEELMNRQRRWEGDENEMKHRKTTTIWQNDTAEIIGKIRLSFSASGRGTPGPWIKKKSS